MRRLNSDQANASNTTATNDADTLLDPLYVIFEHHLFNFNDPELSRDTFIHHIVEDYLHVLKKKAIIVPKSLESHVFEELSSQVNTMLTKKIYGCLNVSEFQKNHVSTQKKQKAQVRYSRLKQRFRRKTSAPS